MGLPESGEYQTLWTEGVDLARQANKPFTSAHLLLAVFTSSNQVVFLLEERGINEDVIIENMRGFQSEPESILGEIRKRAEMYAVH